MLKLMKKSLKKFMLLSDMHKCVLFKVLYTPINTFAAADMPTRDKGPLTRQRMTRGDVQ